MRWMRYTWNGASLALVALAAMLFAALANASGGPEIKGVVQAMPASGLIGTWTIAGQAVCTDAATAFDQEDGPLVVGATVEVKGTPGDPCFLATKIEVKSGDDDEDGPGMSGQVEIKGPVQAMPASGFVGDWMIGGRAVTTTATTTIDQSDGPLVLGAIVEVKGTQSAPGGPITATKLEVQSAAGGEDEDDDDESDGDITGPIESLPDGTFIGTWMVGGQKVIVLTTTRLDQEHGGFIVGAIVEVDGTPSPDGLVASKIETKKSSGAPEPEDDALKIEGLIEELPAGGGLIGTWKVAGVSVEVTADTKLEDDGGPFVVGAPVEVKGFPLPGGGVQATKIETEPGNGAHEPAFVFFGDVEAMPPSGLVGVWTIAGRTVNVTDATELEAEDGPFAVGSHVKVKGWLQDDGAIEAREIETVSKLPTAFSDAGPLSVEFFNASLGHFFMTASKPEIAALDAGAFSGAWTRTGQTMKVGGTVAVCRFYGMPPKGPDSHFFTVDAAECQKVMSDYRAWTFENHAFGITPPVGGTCPVGLVAVHRFYNNPAVAAAMNHRYVTDPNVIADMLALGWTDEGVVMCAQP